MPWLLARVWMESVSFCNNQKHKEEKNATYQSTGEQTNQHLVLLEKKKKNPTQLACYFFQMKIKVKQNLFYLMLLQKLIRQCVFFIYLSTPYKSIKKKITSNHQKSSSASSSLCEYAAMLRKQRQAH